MHHPTRASACVLDLLAQVRKCKHTSLRALPHVAYVIVAVGQRA